MEPIGEFRLTNTLRLAVALAILESGFAQRAHRSIETRDTDAAHHHHDVQSSAPETAGAVRNQSSL
jgi:hypothetical protein